MRTSDRASVLLLSLLLTTISCALAPVTPVEQVQRPIFAVDRNPPPEVLRAETAEIARFLRERETGLPYGEVRHLARVIAVEAHRAGLPPSFVLAVIDVESGGRNFAVSNAGARGLMQVLPATGEAVAAEIGVPWRGASTLFDPVANVRLGVRYLASMIERYRNLHTALAAYNWGPSQVAGRVRRGEAVPRAYGDRVLAAYAGTGREI
jgi:soluble lytic murein transglycosylase-like protein